MRFATTQALARTLRIAPAALLLCAAGIAQAANTSDQCPADGPQSRSACLHEMAAAKQAARSGGLTNPDPSQLQQNAMARCAAFKTDEGRQDCEARVTNRRASGSVGGGGELLEATTPVRN